MLEKVSNISNITETTPKQDRLIALLLEGQSIVKAADAIGIAEKTAHMWLKLPHVQQAYREAKSAIFERAVSDLMLDVSAARQTLKDIMTDTMTSPGVRVRCAQIILESAVKIAANSKEDNTVIARQDVSTLPDEELMMIVQSAMLIRKRSISS